MDTNLPLQHCINELDAIILAVAEAGLQETAALLKIARLDLLIRSNGISEDELDVFLDVVQMNVDWNSPNQTLPQPHACLSS